MDLGENLNDTLKGIIADVRLTQPTYWYAIITAYIALALHDQVTYYSLIVRLDVSDVDDIIELTHTYSTVIINHCDCVWAFVLRTTILVLVVFF